MAGVKPYYLFQPTTPAGVAFKVRLGEAGIMAFSHETLGSWRPRYALDIPGVWARSRST